MKGLELINSVYNRDEGSFLYKLNEGEFDKGLFNEYVYTVHQLSNSADLPKEDRLEIAYKICAISLEISHSLACDYNQMDVYKITGITEEDKLLLLGIIRLIPSFFRFGSKVELVHIFI
jgi:hypothetical protein